MTVATPNGRRPWTTGEQRTLRQQYGQRPTREIAEDLGRTRASVSQQAAKMGLAVRELPDSQLTFSQMRELFEAGTSMAEVARRNGTSRSVVRAALRAVGVRGKQPAGRPSPGAERARADVERMAELYRSFVGCNELASIYGTTENTVIKFLRAEGVEIRPKPGSRSPRMREEAVAALRRHGLLEHASAHLRRSRAMRRHNEQLGKLSNQEDAALGVESMPAGPLAAALRDWCSRTGVDRSELISGETVLTWEAPGALVRGSTADRWLIRLDLLWFDVWPDDAAARRYFEGDDA